MSMEQSRVIAAQTKLGKAFEYRCLRALYEKLHQNQPVIVEDTPQLKKAIAFYNDLALNGYAVSNLIFAAEGAAKMIIRLEPQLEHPADNKPLYLTLQTDANGIEGDVRDVLCIRKQNEWQIGISCKHNHHAVKHSRLSRTIDFGKDWFDLACHKEYFDTITPLFDELAAIKRDSGGRALFKDLPDKAERYYVPILNAFMTEMGRLNDENADIPAKLVSYLIGRYDFYKVITNDADRNVRIEAFNLYGTLNRQAERYKSITRIPLLELPTRFYFVGFEDNSNNTIKVACDKGWEISMRLHNASSRVEPSFKFDVNLISTPNSIYSEVEPYSSI